MKTDVMIDAEGDMMLGKLMHLKAYETPDATRMVRNRQNIMREIRNASKSRRKSVGEALEGYIPWFFAEPKYGIALVFVAFVGLQYLGASSRNSARSTGIYTSPGTLAAYENRTSFSTNRIVYPTLPNSYQLFKEQSGSTDVMLVERLIRN